jgi:hypothetical protein
MDLDWKKVPIPAGLVVAALGAAWVGLGYADGRWLLVSNYQQDRWYDRQIQVSKDYRTLDADVRDLEAKERYAPASFSPQDRDKLKVKREQLRDVDKQLKDIEQQLREKK